MADIGINSPLEELAALLALQDWYEAAGVTDSVGAVPRDYFAEMARSADGRESAVSERGGQGEEAGFAGSQGTGMLRDHDTSRDDETSQDYAPGQGQGSAPRFGGVAAARPAQRIAPAAALSLNPEAALAEARQRAQEATTLDALRQSLEQFDGCSLKRMAMGLVFGAGPAFGAGSSAPRVMVIGETPDADDDKSGQPFSGLRGQFLDRMLEAIGARDSSYRCFLVPWRPAGNAMPPPHDIDVCVPFLHRQIALVRPELLICLGWSAGKLQIGRDMRYQNDGMDVAVLVLPELAELMRSAPRKRKAWEMLRPAAGQWQAQSQAETR